MDKPPRGGTHLDTLLLTNNLKTKKMSNHNHKYKLSNDKYDDDDSSVDLNFAEIEFSGVNFNPEKFQSSAKIEQFLIVLGSVSAATAAVSLSNDIDFGNDQIKMYIKYIQNGDYLKVLQSSCSLFQNRGSFQDIRKSLFDFLCVHLINDGNNNDDDDDLEDVKKGITYLKGIELELIGVAAFSLFLQVNYTGPCLTEDSELELEDLFKDFNRALVLSELAADGEICCSIVEQPYLLLLSRTLFHTLALPTQSHWSYSAHQSSVISKQEETLCLDDDDDDKWNDSIILEVLDVLHSSKIWCGRSAVAHQRLLIVRTIEPCPTLWSEAEQVFQHALSVFGLENAQDNLFRSRLMLEWGLAQHHFEYMDKGKLAFQEAMKLSGLSIELIGAEGKRTKYQQESKAQLLIRTSTRKDASDITNMVNSVNTLPERIAYNEDSHLLEQINFEEEKDPAEDETLNMLHQAILLALCLDVKNENPMDELTCETRMAYLERVLYQPSHQEQQQDWMIYATTLLERSWLEYSHKSSAKERALLQMQALVDQHTQRLTITQSTVQSAVKDSAPAQLRLQNLHIIVYPPRWTMKADLAEKYARIGIVTTAAELFTEVEMWDDVVECYRRAGRENTAEEIVRNQLTLAETPRMWAALGDITKDKSCYEKALELSENKYASAYVALGRYYFEHSDLKLASEMLERGLNLKPLLPGVWFLLGTISMRIKDWVTALKAFSEVVQQEPEEGDAWANVAAIHMHNQDAGRAYPALNEVSVKVFQLFISYYIHNLYYP